MRSLVLVMVLAHVPALASAQTNTTPRHAEIVNDTTGVLREVYISPVNDATWGPDRLTGSTLAVGTARRIDIAATGACMFDIRVAYAQRPREEHLRADLCRNSRVVINGSGRLVNQGEPTCEGTQCPPPRGFMLHYRPVQCIRAPCPPGSYIIMVRGREVARAQELTLRGTDKASSSLASGVAVEGTWAVDRASNRLVVNATAIRDGAWKQ